MTNQSSSQVSSPLAAFLANISSRHTPSTWTLNYHKSIIARGNRRLKVMGDRINGITTGRVMPDRDDITIGSGRKFEVAVLFLDICGFSSRPNWTHSEQNEVLQMMNLFMAEMLSVVKDFGGTYEKNTGDGLMAYFGEDADSEAESVKAAVEAALVMHYFNDEILTPYLKARCRTPLSFRIGIDHGPVTIARVGIRGEMSSRVAIGTAANIACKLMNLIPDGGICVGDRTRENLPGGLAYLCKRCEDPSGFIYIETQTPYGAWKLEHRLSRPTG